ncbi:hypothetical protein NQ314_007087 [Rhamnusium bicolor]|uniref:Uncharacterized protein n=1 Tax=Rhamnusium bicolor TaxID=1586634 RepID=A0AAV8YSE7_9CUCU|nr:hypothetical protein NQ314_007087 [Rhamnusium bicolor]
MDTYNLAVCWGPTIIFITDNTENANGKDIVTQSTDATRLFDALLTFYIENPEELDFGRKKQVSGKIEYLDSNKNPIQRQDSKESIRSSDSNNSKVQKKSASNLCLNVDEVLKKFIELIELNIKNNTPCLEQNNRQKIISLIEDLPKKDTLIYLVRHITKVMEQEPYHKVSKVDMVSIWTNVLNYQRRITDSNEKFSNYLRIVLEVFDEAKPDITLTPKSISNGLLNDLKNYQKDKDRCSKYDNVPEMDTGVSREATILEEKTEELEFTKL